MDSSEERFKKMTMRGRYFRQLGDANEDLRREAEALEHNMVKTGESSEESSQSTAQNDASDEATAAANLLQATRGKNPFGTIKSKRRRNARLLAEINDDESPPPAWSDVKPAATSTKKGAGGEAQKKSATSSSAASSTSSPAKKPKSDDKISSRSSSSKLNGQLGGAAASSAIKEHASSNAPSSASSAAPSSGKTSSKASTTVSSTNGAASGKMSTSGASKANQDLNGSQNASSPSKRSSSTPSRVSTEVHAPVSVVQMNLAHLELQDARVRQRDLESRISSLTSEKKAKEDALATALARIKQLEMAKSPSKDEIETTKMTARNLQKSIEEHKAEQDELERLKKAVRDELRNKNGESAVSDSEEYDNDDDSSSSEEEPVYTESEFEDKWLVDASEVAAALAERRKRKGGKSISSKTSNSDLNKKKDGPKAGSVPKKPSLLEGPEKKPRRKSDKTGEEGSSKKSAQVDALPWFKIHYEQACSTLGVRPIDDLMLVIDRAIAKGRRIMELDLNNYSLTSQDALALTRAFSLTAVEIAKLPKNKDGKPALSNSFEPAAIDLSHNNIVSGRAFVELLLAMASQAIVALDASFNRWGPKASLEFSEGIASYPYLHTLKCSQNDLGPKAGAALMKSLLSFRSLEVLDVSNNGLDDRVAPSLATVITSCPITTLCIKYNKFKASGIKKLAAALAMNTSLIDLDITSIGIGEKSKEIVDILETRQNMQKLCIGFNKLPSSFIPRFTSFSAKQKALAHVDLRGLELSSKHLRQVIDSLSVNCSGTLEELVLNGNVLDSKCMELLIDYVTRTQHLHSLGLRGCGVPKRNLIELLSTVKHSNILRAIDLSGNNLNDRRILEALNSCLQVNATLSIVAIAACKLDAKSIGAVGQALQFNKALEKIHIDGNKLGERGLVEFANGLAGNEVLKVVSVRTTAVTARGLIAFISAITAKSQVEVIDAGDNNLPLTNKAFRDRISQYDAVAVKF